MNLTYTRPGELRKPEVDVLPDGRLRITRFIAAGHGDRDYGEITADVGTADAGLNTALLVKRGLTRVEGKDCITLTYEVRNPSAETQVGREDVQFGENGLKTVINDLVQMSSGTYTPQTIGVSASSLDTNCILRQEIMEDDGTSRTIRRVYINKGLLNETNEIHNNGALLIKTLVYLNDQPTPNPPTGYTLFNTRIENPNGLETTTYSFAKGNGKISEDNETRNYGALYIRTIRWITAPGADNPIPAQSGYTSFSSGYVEQDGYRIWTSQFAQGNGQLSEQTETKYNGALYLRTIRYASDPSVTVNPIATPDGYTLVSVSTSVEGGVKIWTAQYAKGTGQISREDDTKNNGALLIANIRYISTPSISTNPIATPNLYTLVSVSMAEQDGYRIWSASYAKGTGQIGQDEEIRNNGALSIRTIRYISAPSVDSNPITTPIGYTNVSYSYVDQDGHRIWTASYAIGTGQIGVSDETKNNGSLLIQTIRYISTPSITSNPISTPFGYTLTSVSYADQEGHRVWTASYAKGNGQISQDDETKNNGALLIRVIRYISTPSVSSNPITTPPTYTKFSESYTDQDGYRVWSGSYAKGVGTISSSTEYRNKGLLVIYRITALGSVPSTPSATIGGTVVLISSDTRYQDGYTLYDYTWAEGSGTITSETDSRNQGKLKVYHIVSLGINPSTPSATIGGTVVLTDDATRQESGVTIYDKRWAEGKGVLEKHIQTRDAGLRLETWVSLGETYDDSFMQPAGVVMMKDQQLSDGVTRWTVTCMQSATGGAPTSYTYSTESYEKFNYPGRAGWATITRTVGGSTSYSKDVFLSPPVSALVLATTTISYQTATTIGSLTYSLWNPTQWATLIVSINTLAANGQPKTVAQGLEGYTAWSGYDTFSITSNDPSYSSAMGYWLAASSSAAGSIYGGPVMPNGSTTYTLNAYVEKTPAFVSYDGTPYYRKVVITATPPAPGGVTP